MTQELSNDLRAEADLCRNEVANDIAGLLDQSATEIDNLFAALTASHTKAAELRGQLDLALETVKRLTEELEEMAKESVVTVYAPGSTEAAELKARVEWYREGLQIIANEDWTWATVEEMREVARRHIEETPA